jgi:hypothetical protein
MAVGNVVGFSSGASGNWHKYVFFSSVCSLIDLGFMSQQLELVLMLSSYNR